MSSKSSLALASVALAVLAPCLKSCSSSVERQRGLRGVLAVLIAANLGRLVSKGQQLVRPALLWIAAEFAWAAFMRAVLIPERIRSLRLADMGKCDPGSFHRTVDLAESALQKDQRGFWRTLTRIASAERIPRVTVKSYTRSLLYVNPDADLTASKLDLIEQATDRLEAASGKSFKRQYSGEENCAIERSPSTISGWTDDRALAHIVRATPLAVCLSAELSVTLAMSVLTLFGWRKAPLHSSSGLEAWIYSPDSPSEAKPLILFPGLACGFVSFLPFALRLQAKLSRRRLVLFRLPWAEIGMPLEAMPQWDEIIAQILGILSEASIEEADVISHSYGTNIANRLLRRLCGLDSEEGLPAPPVGFRKINAAVFLEPMIFGDLSAGVSCGMVNSLGLDINTASLTNRGGVPWKETMFYNPQDHAQCLAGIFVYAAVGDMLLEVKSTEAFCQKYMPGAHFYTDKTWASFHGRFLVELWCGGIFAPCISHVMALIQQALNADCRP